MFFGRTLLDTQKNHGGTRDSLFLSSARGGGKTRILTVNQSPLYLYPHLFFGEKHSESEWNNVFQQ